MAACLFSSLLFSCCGDVTGQPVTVMWSAANLNDSKSYLADPSSDLQPALKKLLSYADHWKNESEAGRTFSVMSKPEAGPSGDKHDFYSLGTYWWPNPNTSTGLPYIRKDGLVNPETFKYDSVPISQMIFAVSNLSLAYYFTGEDRYCTAAASFIDTWFLDPATRMNPRTGLEYAQLRRGLDKGRGIGIIDAKDLAFVPDSAALLAASPCAAWPATKQAALGEWLQEYVAWLSSSAHAAAEFAQKNNHGTWFDIQALSLSLSSRGPGAAAGPNAHAPVNRSWALAIVRDAKTRVGAQIARNGTMPLELARTRSMHYTWWNMIAFFELAHTSTAASTLLAGAASAGSGGGEHEEHEELEHGEESDLFHYTSAVGGNSSLRGALGFVAPFAANATTRAVWPYAEETPFDHGKFFQILRMASRVWGGGGGGGGDAYERMIPELPGDVDYEGSVINLLWPKVRL